MCTLGPGAIVMDIGCGDTFVVERLAAEYRDAVFYAVDTAFTEELVEHYRARLNNPRILPFPSLEAIAPPLDAAGLADPADGRHRAHRARTGRFWPISAAGRTSGLGRRSW